MTSITSWLLNSDPAVAWQCERDLLGASDSVWEKTRTRVATEGWGAQLLALRAKDGTWGGGLYSPKWTSTFYTLRLLYGFGLEPTHPAAVQTCALLLDAGFDGSGGICFWNNDARDVCVTAMMVSMACHFGHGRDERVGAMVGWLLEQQLADGGWNCRSTRTKTYKKPLTKSSFHTTLSTLEGLHDYANGPMVENDEYLSDVLAALNAGYTYFLRHEVYKTATHHRVVKESFTRFSFPVRWYFDVLRALDHFRLANMTWDPRLANAVDIIHQRRRDDGYWTAQNHHPGAVYFQFQKVGTPSPWNTLRALRVLKWAENPANQAQ